MNPFQFGDPMEDDGLSMLAETLTRRCGLSPDDVKRISQAQRVMRIPFVEAALTLGYVTQEDVESAIASAGKIAVIRRKLKPSSELVVVHDPFDRHSERIRALRTELLMRRDLTTEGANVLAIVSAGPREGRSMLAAELAVSFSQLGQPTLLVDADLRNPSLHQLFSTEPDAGLASALVKGQTPEVWPVAGLPHLFVVTSGQQAQNPLELLSDYRLGSIIESWRSRYQHIVIDTPPVSLYADGLAVAMAAGQVVVVSRAARTSFDRTRELLRRLEATRARVVGSVLGHY